MKTLLPPSKKEFQTIPYGRQWIDSEDIEGVVEVLKSDWVTQGPRVSQFEKTIADYCGAKYAVAVSSGTAALHLACLAAGFKPGDEAITTPITFAATANAVLYTGARPRFADIQYDTGNIDPIEIEKLISGQTKAILPVHLAGLPVDLEEIHQLAAKRRILIIEDACHAMGAEYRGSRIGSCKYSDMTAFSFHPVKQITTGEGGCITTNNEKFYRSLKAMRNHGIYKDNLPRKEVGGWFYEIRSLGFNYRITDIQCALGLSQLRKIDQFLRRRSEIARCYDEAFSELGDIVNLPAITRRDRTHAWHLYFLRSNLKKSKIKRRWLYDQLRSKGIQVQVHYIPVYRHPIYRSYQGTGKISCPNAEKFYEEVLSLPIFPGLTDEEVERVIHEVRTILKK